MKTLASDRLTVVAFVILIATIVLLLFELSKAWQNERFLDAELNKMTPPHNPMQK